MEKDLPKGFRASSAQAGFKAPNRYDLGLIVSDRPAQVAALFTTNVFCAAPVQVCREVVRERGVARAVVANSGQANACTGEEGLANCRETRRLVAEITGIAPEEVLTLSTGVIGAQLRMDRWRAAMPELKANLGTRDAEGFTRAFMTTDASGASVFYGTGAIVAFVTLAAAVVFSSMGGIVGTVPVLLAIIVGYVVSLALGLVDFAPVAEAAWVGLPQISAPHFDPGAIALVAPVAVVVVIEHIGHLLAVGEIVGKDYREMLPRSLAGDGISTVISGFLGGPPTTTYAENIGVMSVTRVYSTQIFWYAAGFALVVGGFCPKLAALIQSIPSPVMGGVSLLLFGLIASNGLRMLVSNNVDFDVNRNLMIASVVIILGVGMETSGISIPIGDYTLPGMATSTLVGILMNLVLPRPKDA